MSLTINHNLMASNTARNLSTHYGALGTSVRRLSSGLRVGTAADDAAGLAVRELMRSDIRTLNQGIRNANDAVSMIQTADGALQVIDEKLIRMKELATQAASGTYNSDQRKIINQEYTHMALEIQRISNATDFNGIHLLNGNLSDDHRGNGVQSTGAAKIHFGTGNDCAEDYYYVNIGSSKLNDVFQNDEETVFGDTTMDSVLLYEGDDEQVVNTNSSNDQVTPAVAGLEDNGYVVTWSSENQDGSGYGIYARTYNNNGEAVSAEVQVNTTTLNDQTAPEVTGLSNGNYVATWTSDGQDGSGLGVYAQVMDANNQPVGTEFKVNSYNTNDQSQPAVTSLNNGTFVVTWQSTGQDGSQEGIYAKVFNNDGTLVKDEFRVNTVAAEDQTRSEVAAMKDGGFVVTWTSGLNDADHHGIAVQRYDKDGNAVGTERVVNTVATGEQGYSSVVGLDDGSYAVSWWSEHEGVGRDTYVKIYDANDNVIQDEFRINDTLDGNQHVQVMTALDGGFAITYASQDVDGGNILTKLYSNDGTELSTEVMANDYTTGRQFWPESTTLSDGSFVVVWESENVDGSGYGISSKKYTPVVSVVTQELAQESLDRIQDAMIKKDKIRANLGVMQNRLENTITNLSIQAENLQASESRISDVDVATEMSEFVRRQILTQSATAMLAQANSLPKMAMQLIGG